MANSTRPKGTSERQERPKRTLADLQENPPRWFTIDELCTWFGVSKWTIEELIRKDAIVSNRIGGHRRVSYANLLAYEKATTESAAAVS